MNEMDAVQVQKIYACMATSGTPANSAKSRICVVCGDIFSSKDDSANTCSRRCKVVLAKCEAHYVKVIYEHDATGKCFYSKEEMESLK